MKYYVVSYVDYGDTCDGHAGVVGIYTSREKAEKAVKLDMASYCDNLTDEEELSDKDYVLYKDKMEVWRDIEEIGQNGCTWSIHECNGLD